ncbi:MAG: HPr family phosphocarrier protein [Candidatus Sumerlaeota bacterium]
MSSASARVEIQNVMGIHLRPASSIVQIANQYPDCEVELSKDGQSVNGRSIMGVIMLAAEQGSIVDIKVTGDGCEDLLKEIVELIDGKFGEE